MRLDEPPYSLDTPMKFKLIFLTVCVLALVGCNQDHEVASRGADPAPSPVTQDPATTQAEVAPPPAPPAGSRRVVSAVGEGPASALKLSGNESASGAYVPTADGTLVAFGVYIGNSRGTADGSLTLNLCKGESCRDVTLPLLGSRDNDFLIFTLDDPLLVTTGETLSYRLRHSADATKPVAIWTYAPGEGVAGLVGPSGEDTGRLAKVAMYLQQHTGT